MALPFGSNLLIVTTLASAAAPGWAMWRRPQAAPRATAGLSQQPDAAPADSQGPGVPARASLGARGGSQEPDAAPIGPVRVASSQASSDAWAERKAAAPESPVRPAAVPAAGAGAGSTSEDELVLRYSPPPEAEPAMAAPAAKPVTREEHLERIAKETLAQGKITPVQMDGLKQWIRDHLADGLPDPEEYDRLGERFQLHDIFIYRFFHAVMDAWMGDGWRPANWFRDEDVPGSQVGRGCSEDDAWRR
jgi:hypothetical protein